MTDIRRGTFKLNMPKEIDTRETAMIKEICEALANEVADLTGIGFRLYMEEYDLTNKHMSWQARLISVPEILQTNPESAPILPLLAQISYEAFNHSNSKENYHGTFSMMIQTIAVPGGRVALAAGKKWLVDSRAYSILRLAESQYRSAIKTHYHEWGTNYKDGLLFTDKPGAFMRDLQVYPEFKPKKSCKE